MLWERKNTGFEGNGEVGERSCGEQQNYRVPGMILQAAAGAGEEHSLPSAPRPAHHSSHSCSPLGTGSCSLLAFPAPGKGLLWAGASHKHHSPSPAAWHCLHKLSCGLAWEVIKRALVRGLFLSTACKPSDPLTTCSLLAFDTSILALGPMLQQML